jgi:dTDP-glucose 4,6-dehydratase
MKSILVTGGSGFIGSHFIRHVLAVRPDWKVVNIDVLSYAGNVENNADYKDHPQYHFYPADIGDLETMCDILEKENIDTIINFAAESDNNKAVNSPLDFVQTNALGTATLCEAARICTIKRLHHISTCEVFGQLELGEVTAFTESSPYRPRTPYNASKASADHMVMSYFHTYGLPVTISYCANNYGTHQFPEKIIPVFIAKALAYQPLPMFASKNNKREWIHVSDHCKALLLILEKGAIGETYNIGTGVEKSIEDIADAILHATKTPATLKTTVPDRPGHDARYLLNSTKIAHELGWMPEVIWEKGLEETVAWYIANKAWWEPLLAMSHSWK